MNRTSLLFSTLIAAGLFLFAEPTLAQQNKPNILVIWGDDIGSFNISAYNMGMRH